MYVYMYQDGFICESIKEQGRADLGFGSSHGSKSFTDIKATSKHKQITRRFSKRVHQIIMVSNLKCLSGSILVQRSRHGGLLLEAVDDVDD